MKALFLEWNSMGKFCIMTALKRNGCEVDTMAFPKETEDVRLGKNLTEKILMQLIKGKHDFVFSTNYYPVAAIACQTYGIPYISWCYDSPLINLFSNTIFYDTNYVFEFDRGECENLWKAGAKSIYHLPLAASPEVLDTYKWDMLSANQRKRFASDISFVGSLYTEKDRGFQYLLDGIDEYTKGFVDALVNAQRQIYGCYFLESAMTEQVVNTIHEHTKIDCERDGFETLSWMYANYILGRKLAAEERFEILDRLSQKYSVKLFTESVTDELSKVQSMGPVDYYKECPYVFKGSKINLNISLRSILTGMPLRVFDIMGSGGFLLTNYQEELLEYFEPNVDFVYYDSIDDLEEKAEYYLAHDQERQKIAQSGYEKVKQYHTYDIRIRQILETVFGKTS